MKIQNMADSVSTSSTISINSIESIITDSEFQFFKNSQPPEIPSNQLNENNKDSVTKIKKSCVISSSPNHILINLLRPLLLCCRVLGLFPLQLREDGSITYCFWSFPSIYSLVYLAIHLCISGIFLMFIKYILFTMSQVGSFVDYVAQMVFMVGQCATGVSTMVASHLMARSLSRFWNRLQKVINTFDCTQQRPFRHTYIVGRIALGIWLILALIYGMFGVIYFWKYLEVYFEKDTNSFFFFYAISFSIFFIQMSGHLLQSMLFISICRIIQNCFTVLMKSSPSKIKDFNSFVEQYNLFATLDKLCDILGRIYGFYIITEMIVTITSGLVNIYFCIYITSNFHQGFAVIIPPTTVMFHAIWLFSMCNASQRLQKEAARAMKVMREAAVYNLTSETNIQIQGLLVALSKDAPCITASEFFRLNRRLITKIIAVLTTYLIFIVQIKTDLSEEEIPPLPPTTPYAN